MVRIASVRRISELVDTGLAEAFGLSGAAGASKLREAGYTPDMLAASGALSSAIGSWDMKLAGLVPQSLPQLRTPPAPAALPAAPAAAAAAVVVNPRGSQAGAAGSQDPGAGEAAQPQQQQVPPRPSVRVVSPAPVEPSHHHQQQQRGAPALVLAGTEEELRFFRKGIKGVMQLKPGQGIQPVILGTAYSTVSQPQPNHCFHGGSHPVVISSEGPWHMHHSCRWHSCMLSASWSIQHCICSSKPVHV
jgi:hypothetical protein